MVDLTGTGLKRKIRSTDSDCVGTRDKPSLDRNDLDFGEERFPPLDPIPEIIRELDPVFVYYDLLPGPSKI